MNIRKVPLITACLIVINIVLFIVQDLSFDTEETISLYQHGAFYYPDVIDGQWYRLLKHMFMHSGLMHLVLNMFMLGVVGNRIEDEYGKIKYLITYMISGLGGAMLTGITESLMNDCSVAVGASGAIMGVFGAMLVVEYKNKKDSGVNVIIQMLVIFAIVVFGNMEEGVSWLDHMYGAVIGILMTLIMYRNHDGDFSLEV